MGASTDTGGKTYTDFGRHHQKLRCLEEAVAQAAFDGHNALIVGAGLYSLTFSSWLKGTSLENNPGLQRPYSWEVMEVAAILERQGKPWTITVVDDSAKVCAALAQQESVIIHDFYSLMDSSTTDYARSFLAAIGVSGNDDTVMEAINKAFQSQNVGNRLSVFKKVVIPPQIKDRIKVVHGSITDLSSGLSGVHNVATCFNVMMYVPAGFRDSAAQSLNHAIAEGGIVASDTAITGFKPIRTFLDETEIEGGYGGSYTLRQQGYIMVKQPELKHAKVEEALQQAVAV